MNALCCHGQRHGGYDYADDDRRQQDGGAGRDADRQPCSPCAHADAQHASRRSEYGDAGGDHQQPGADAAHRLAYRLLALLALHGRIDIRDGAVVRIPGREVVREDLLILSEGDRIPADGELLSAHELAVDESLLTGESLPVAKGAAGAAANAEECQRTRVFAGTLVTSGQGIARVSAIGADTELGRIGKSLATIETETSPLQRELGRLTRQLAVIGIALCALLVALYIVSRGGWMAGLLAGITLAMSLLPQEFPVIMIVFMALGARRMARQRVLTRRLNAIETLGETTVLCVDKTGTLTQNRMAVATLIVGDDRLDQLDVPDATLLAELPERFHELLEYCVLASETDPHDPMEQAFHRMAHDYLDDTEHLHDDWDLAREYELSPELMAMSHLWRVPGNTHQTVACKGAPEAIADLCHLDAATHARVARQAALLAERGLRVLGVAKAVHHEDAAWPEIQHDFDFEFLGLVGLADPLRAEVPAAVEECRRAGIRVIMITGDHPRTAQAIATRAGIDGARVLTGTELQQGANLDGVSVFARVTPAQKLAIVAALKARGEIVAMTGDGVNDAPALKAAHIGIAMGKRGTDVAREAASLVLLDDDFGAIVHAIRQGRRIFANLRQAMIYTLAVHIPIIGLSSLPLLFGLPLLLAPIHIAFFELVIDPSCSIVFEAEQADRRIMQRPPRSPQERLLAPGHIALSVTQGLLTTLVVFWLYHATLAAGIAVAEAHTLAFIALIAANAVLIFSSRSPQPGLTATLRGIHPVSYWVLGGTALGLLAVTCIPLLAAPFAFAPTTWQRWLGACAIGAGSFVLYELAKLAGGAARRLRSGAHR